MRKMAKIILIIIIILAVLLISIGLFAGNYFYNLALNPHSDKSSVLEAPHNEIGSGSSEGSPESGLFNSSWLTEMETEDTYIQSYDNLKLRAITVNQETPSDRWVILCHGYTGDATNMSNSARHFYEMGFNILIPDARGHGESEGDYIGMGWHERLDMTSWIQTLVDKNSESQIILYGVSMGGATVMMTSGEDLPNNVKAIVEDCGYTSVKGEFTYQLKETFSLPSFPIIQFASLVTYLRAGYTLGEADAVSQVAKSKTPMLFIHGTDDTFVPFSMMDEVYEAANTEKEKFIVEGAGHGMAASVAGDLYWETVELFINKYLN